MYLLAMCDYVVHGSKIRRSALYTDPQGDKPYAWLPDTFTYLLDSGELGDQVQGMVYQDGECRFEWCKVRPVPEDDDFFENVWREFREHGNTFIKANAHQSHDGTGRSKTATRRQAGTFAERERRAKVIVCFM